MYICVESALPVVSANGLNTNVAVDFSNSTSVALPAGTTIGGSSVAERNLDRITVALALIWSAAIVALGLLMKTA